MANKFARSNGDFNNPSIWSLLAGSMSATTVPTIGDNAIANTFTIQITGNVTCDNITNGIAYGGSNSGRFNLNNGTTLVANIFGGGSGGIETVTLSGTNSSVIIGNITGGFGIGVNGVTITGSGNLTHTGSTLGGYNGCQAISNNGSGALISTGNANGAPPGPSAAAAISNTSTGSVTFYGIINGAATAGISNTSTGSVTVLGNVFGDSRGSAGITSTNAAANVRISGNLIGAPNGIPAVYAASYTVNPVPNQSYIRYANNGTGVGSDAYLYYYTTDSLSAFSIPPVSAVRAGLQYANNTLTGTCQIPTLSSVAFGALVDNTTGTAAITSNELFNISLASLAATDSVGVRLKNSATVESIGRIIASFSN
jgi:hypothetical protein